MIIKLVPPNWADSVLVSLQIQSTLRILDMQTGGKETFLTATMAFARFISATYTAASVKLV